MLNKFVLSRWSEELGVALIFLENRDICVEQNCWGVEGGFLREIKHEPQPAGFTVVVFEGVRGETRLLQEQIFRNRNKQGWCRAMTGSFCVF